MRLRRLLLVAGVVVLAASCGDDASDSSSSSGDGGSAASSMTSNNAGSGAGSTTSNMSSGSGGAPMSSVSICQKPCSTVADCVLQSGAFDEDNYSCNGGVCVWSGCNNDSECSDVGSGFLCREPGNTGLATCLSPCSTAKDCDLGLPSADEDNYTCDSGACVFTGCTDDAECQTLEANYVCRDIGAGFPTCVMSCATAADCDSPFLAYDADNYLCTDGVCIYSGCKNDAECMDGGQDLICK